MRIQITNGVNSSFIHLFPPKDDLFKDAPICIGYSQLTGTWIANVSTVMGTQFLRDEAAEELGLRVMGKLWPTRDAKIDIQQMVFDKLSADLSGKVQKRLVDLMAEASDADDGGAHVS